MNPFLEDDELWEEYLPRMKANGTWGGQMEIQAFSLAYSVNITIHQLGQLRWDILNFHGGMKTIHLSYHQGEHYSSVRKIGDVNHTPEAPKEIILHDSKKTSMKPPHEEEKRNITPEELLVMETTGCQNREFILALLIDNNWDVDATVEFIFTIVGPDNIEFQHEYLAEKQQDSSKSPRYPSTSSTITTTITSNQMDPPQVEEEKSHPRKEKKENVHPHKKKKDVECDEVEKENNVHPKLAKFSDNKLSNRERKERARQNKDKQTLTVTEKPPLPPPPVEVVDVTTIVQDLGSMQI